MEKKSTVGHVVTPPTIFPINLSILPLPSLLQMNDNVNPFAVLTRIDIVPGKPPSCPIFEHYLDKGCCQNSRQPII